MLILSPDIEGQVCGNIDLTAAEVQAYLSTATALTATNGTQNYLLPIHFTVVKNTQGATSWCNESIQRELDAANAIFPTNIKFYTCEITEVTSDVFHDMALDFSNIGQLNAQNNDNNAINCYLVNSIGGGAVIGFGFMPPSNNQTPLISSNSVFIASADGTTLSHELGHYLGLFHTHQGFGNSYDVSNPNQLVNPPDCTGVGDFLCDTPTDPGRNLCFGCRIFCYDNQGQPKKDTNGDVYSPDISNIMSYHSSRCGASHFSQDQIQKMTNILEATIGQSRQFLIDLNEPTCSSPEFSNFSVSGKLERIWDDGTAAAPNIILTPMGGNFVLANTTTPPTSFFSQAAEYLTGAYQFDGLNFCKLSSPGNGWRLKPNEDATAPVNGVNMFDAVALHRHVLNIELLKNQPFSLIAADVNNSGYVTTSDIVEIRKLVLGIYNKFPKVDSWRYIPRYYLESDVDFATGFFDEHPFDATYQGRTYKTTPIWLNEFYPPAFSQFDYHKALNWSFYGIKSGDVNGDAMPSGLFTGDDPTKLNIEYVPHTCLQAGQSAEVLLKSLSNIPLTSYQFDLSIRSSKLQLLGIKSGDLPYFSGTNFNVDNVNGQIKTVWFNESGIGGLNCQGLSLFKIQVKANQQVCDIGQALGLGTQMAKVMSGNDRILPSATIQVTVQPFTKKHNLESVYPNPLVGNSVAFKLELGSSESVSIVVQDYIGNTASQSGNYLTGSNLIQVTNLSNLVGTQLSYQITAGTEIFSGTILKPN